MISQFKKIAEVTLVHGYYSPTDNIAISFEPNSTTKALFNRYGILFKTIQNGFQIYKDTNQTVEAFLNYLTGNNGVNRFEIRMLTINADFYLFTEMPLNWDGLVNYSNAETSKTEEVLNPDFSDEKPNPDYGLITLNFSGLIEQEAPGYTIAYEPRKTQWNYYIINRSQVALTDPFIDTKSDIEFSSPQEVTLPTNEKAMLFSSGDQLIALSHYANQKFTLSDKSSRHNGTKTKVIFSGLPNPFAARMEQISINDRPQLASPMYVYL